jgi:hypothetical protein
MVAIFGHERKRTWRFLGGHWQRFGEFARGWKRFLPGRALQFSEKNGAGQRRA